MGIEIIAALIASAGVTGTIGATGIAVSTVAAYALVGGVVVGGTLLVQELQPKQHTNEQQTVKQACPARQRVYGRALCGGAYYFFASEGSTLVAGFLICEGPIDAFEQHWFNEQISPDFLALYGHADMWPWQQQVDFGAQLGNIPQGPNGVLSSSFHYWDASHGLNGIANVVMRCFLPSNPTKNFTKYFPSGVPTYRCVIRGSRVYDPRQASQNWNDRTTWAWSQNPAVCILDYLTIALPDGNGNAIPRGMGVAQSNIDLDSFKAMADLCDGGVVLASGGLENRYILWGAYTLDEEPKDVLSRMLLTCDGELYMTSAGKIALRGGQWSVPTVTLTADHVLSLDVQKGKDKLSKYNQLRVRYTSLPQQYQQIEGDPWDDIAAQKAAGEILPQDFDAKMVPSYTQACRLAKIKMAKDNPDWVLTITTNIYGLMALGERGVNFVFPDLGINGTFFVNSFEIEDSGSSCKIGLGSLDSGAYEWSTAEEQNGGTAANVNVAAPYTPEAPSGLVLSLNRIATGSGSIATISATISPPSDTTLSIVAQYRASGTTGNWLDMAGDSVAYTAVSDVVSDNTKYDVQVCLASYAQNRGSFATSSVTVVVDNASPGAASNFSAAPASDGGGASLAWTTPNATNYYASDVFYGTSPDLSKATLQRTVYNSPGQQTTFMAQRNAGQNFYWVTCKNRSGVGTSTGPVELDL